MVSEACSTTLLIDESNDQSSAGGF